MKFPMKKPSNKYKHGDKVPTTILVKRLRELARAVADGPDAVRREFTMRVPAELDRDADLVMHQAAARLEMFDELERSILLATQEREKKQSK